MKRMSKHIFSFLLALCIFCSCLALPGWALSFGSSTGAQERNANDIQPMTFDYVRKNINSMVQNMGNKYVLKDSTNVDLSRDIYIVDPRIVSVRVDTSDVDWNTYGCYPIRYTVCFKPSSSDKYDTNELDYKAAREYDNVARLGGLTIASQYGGTGASEGGYHTNRSTCYTYTNCASKLNTNEYVTLTFGAKVNIGAEKYLDNFVNQAVPVYQSNTNMYSISKAPSVPSKYYKNLSGAFTYKPYIVTTPFKLIVGEDGVYCNYCGKKYTDVGAHSYMDSEYVRDGIHAHSCDGDGSWTTFSGDYEQFAKGDSFHIEIFTINS